MVFSTRIWWTLLITALIAQLMTTIVKNELAFGNQPIWQPDQEITYIGFIYRKYYLNNLVYWLLIGRFVNRFDIFQNKDYPKYDRRVTVEFDVSFVALPWLNTSGAFYGRSEGCRRCG